MSLEAAETAAAAAAGGGSPGAKARENESIAAATHRAPGQRVGDRRIAGPAPRRRDVAVAAALGGDEEADTRGSNELPREAFKAHSEEVMKAHGFGSTSRLSPLASKQPVVDVGMQNKQMDSRRAHAGVLQGRKGA